jgi:hypothetical protein
VNVLAVTAGRPFTWTKVVSSEYCNLLKRILQPFE